MNQSQLYITVIASSIFFTFGIFGNIISIIIFRNKEFKKQPDTTYLIGACAMNIVTIIYLPVMMTSTSWMITTTICKLFGGLMLFINEFQAWLTAVGSLDRFLSITMPFKFQFKNKLSFQLSLLLILIIILLGLIAPNLVFYEKNVVNDTIICSLPDGPHTTWVLPYFKYQVLLFRAALPFLIMILSSVLIIFKVCKMKRTLTSNTNRHKEIQLAKTSDCFFIIFRIPILVYLLLYSKNSDYLIFTYTFSIYVAISTINNSFIFVILIITNKVYKESFFELVKFKISISISKYSKPSKSTKTSKVTI